jgi:hypothetical protein
MFAWSDGSAKRDGGLPSRGPDGAAALHPQLPLSWPYYSLSLPFHPHFLPSPFLLSIDIFEQRSLTPFCPQTAYSSTSLAVRGDLYCLSRFRNVNYAVLAATRLAPPTASLRTRFDAAHRPPCLTRSSIATGSPMAAAHSRMLESCPLHGLATREQSVLGPRQSRLADLFSQNHSPQLLPRAYGHLSYRERRHRS